MKRPNIVHIHAHDMGRFCEPMGYPIPAPNMMRLAKSGVLFRHCHASAPTCAPSRAALMTGQYPHCCGMLGLPSPKLHYKLNDYNQHLAAYLKSQGYVTAISGAQHETPHDQRLQDVLPYDHFLNFETPHPQQKFDPGQTTPRSIDFLMEERDEPFFLSVGYLDPHRDNRDDPRIFIESFPMVEPSDIDDRARYVQPWPHLPDNAVTRREMANFQMGVAVLDAEVGRLLDALDTPRLRASTLVVFTSDHGPGVCEMKATLRENGTGVVSIFSGPGNPDYGPAVKFSGGQVCDALTQHMDYFPTFCEAADIAKPDWLQGKSIFPLMDGAEQIHEEIFTEQTYHWNDDSRPLRAVRTERYRYIRSYRDDQRYGVDPGPAENWWREQGYGAKPYPREQLFDLWFDPHEAHNLIDSPEHAGILADSRARLDGWQQATNDPIRQGIPTPPARM